MAPNATNHQRGRAARAINRLLQAPRPPGLSVAVEIALLPLGLPAWAHLVLAGLDLVVAAAAWH